jgi:hypothetical protein
LRRNRRSRRGRRQTLLPFVAIGSVALACLIGALLLLTGGESEPSQASSSAAGSGESGSSRAGRDAAPVATAIVPEGTAVSVRVVQGVPFVWPADGTLLAKLGPLHPTGIDIGLAGSVAVRAAGRGIVTSAGPDSASNLGIQVVIDHGDGLSTVYGFLQNATVSPGQVVAQGEAIGTGASRLYFEVNHRGLQIDPLDVLPTPNEGSSRSATLDCQSEAIVVPAGAPVSLDFAGSVESDAVVAGVNLQSLTPSTNTTAVRAASTGPSTVLFETAPSVVDSTDDAFKLSVGLQGDGERDELSCTVFVRSKAVEPSIFDVPTSTPAPRSSGQTPTSPTPTPTGLPTQQPTPPPTATSTPTLIPTPTKTPFPLSN